MASPDGWNRDATPMTRGDYGLWHIKIPGVNGQPAIPHNSKIKVGGRLELHDNMRANNYSGFLRHPYLT